MELSLQRRECDATPVAKTWRRNRHGTCYTRAGVDVRGSCRWP
ncbi:hypothetical protein ERO13_A08G053301v2 [Gossypium hirsutum]|uniref:Uncharacterized protein n=1 Tax=Gossypium mustelinum TaxID=34275 RepID=A0A5D2Y4S8_GOSMU|nr:hypothetical protein ERO13_A08G053301v2 [Gossypium hirsutum]TYJ21418.1 hypothetical protein E1A91_A08G063200v1 [Gossypium mustelinum]